MKQYLLSVLLFGLGGISTAIAEPQMVVAEATEPLSDQVRLEMMVVYGTTRNTAVDPQLRPLMKYFRNYKFTGFSLIDSQKSKLHDKSAKTFSIEGNRKVTVSLLTHSKEKAKLKVVILEGKNQKILDTTININRNGTFIVAGPKYKDGILFLPFSVKY